MTIIHEMYIENTYMKQWFASQVLHSIGQ